MRLRREQGLLLATALVAALLWFNQPGAPPRVQVRPQVQDYEPAGLPASALLPPGGGGREGARVELFREPSESTPLPPRPLPEPPAAALPVVALPLGQHASAFRLLRGPGEVKEAVALEASAPAAVEPAPAVPGNGAAPAPAAGNGSDNDYARTYDLVETVRGDKWWGEVLHPNKVQLTRGSPPDKVKFRWISAETGKVHREFEIEGKDIKSISLAKTLRNEVAARLLEVTDEVANLPARAATIEWLLQQATREGWVYEEALKLARGYAAIAPDKVDGFRMVARVLRASGRLADEWTLYQTLPADVADTPFRWAGQGSIEALLALDGLAEQHLRQAIARGGDPRAAVAMCEFLLARGRTDEAVPVARLAYRDRNKLERPDERLAFQRCLVSVYLAAGMLQEARDMAGALPNEATALRGAVAYAAGDLDFAAGQFRAAAEANDMPGLAALGTAACAARAGRWAEAQAGFAALADRDPILRARALGGIGFVLERTGNFEAAASVLLGALQVDPTDAYLAYLRGRALRLAGDLDGAADQLTQALRRRDDLVEAMAELAETYLRIAQRDEGRAVESLVRAVRYVDRCVVLDAQLGGGKPAVRYLELQGLVRWRAGELRGARAAFTAARDAGSTYGQVGLALIDYAQGRTETAREQLADLDKRPLGDPFREFGRSTLAAIADHAEKVEIRDDFERDELGARWTLAYTGRTALRPGLEKGQLVLRGSKVEQQSTTARRTLDSAGDFVAAEVVLERSTPDDTEFAGLRLSVGRDEKNKDLEVRLGFKALAEAGTPALQFLDGDEARASTPEEQAKFEWRPLEVGSARGPQHLLLEFLPDGEQGLLLRASWNGRVVAEEKVTRVRRGARQQPMHVDLLVEGRHGQVNLTFDRFRLRQRQRP
jgi:tetratricopeptide (TPR) repeat protein